jgi:hypothetical protein
MRSLARVDHKRSAQPLQPPSEGRERQSEHTQVRRRN